LAAWPVVVRAQQPGRLPTIGYLGATSASGQSQWTMAFTRRLHELGWAEGRTIRVEYRWAEGNPQRAAEMAAELVRLKIDVIVTAGSANVSAAKRATSTIPIVFAGTGDPVGNNLVASLARPGGNITGSSLQQTDLGAKRFEILRELVPSLRRLAIMAYVGSAGAMLEVGEVQAAAKLLTIETVAVEIQQPKDIAPAFEALKGKVEALLVAADPLLTTHRIAINTLASAARLPTIYNFREYVEAGGLISYGPNLSDMYRRAADYVDKILRGAKPADLPVEQPTKFDLVINLTTARAIGLEIPPTLFARTDEVIE
jgi:putative ABC transport system substrate-binding protein